MIPQGRKLTLFVEPLNDKIGSIIMPESAVKKNIVTRTGVVKQLGTDKAFNFEVEVGDKVMFNRHGEVHEADNVVLIKKDSILYVYPKN